MSKWVRIIFLSSLAMNVILVICFVYFRSSVNATIFRLNAIKALSDASLARYVLQEVESGDANRINDMKQYLRESIAVSSVEAEEYRRAAE